jgi:hypothetical protein
LQEGLCVEIGVYTFADVAPGHRQFGASVEKSAGRSGGLDVFGVSDIIGRIIPSPAPAVALAAAAARASGSG